MSNTIEQFDAPQKVENRLSTLSGDVIKDLHSTDSSRSLQNLADATSRMVTDGQLPPMSVINNIVDNQTRRVATQEAQNAERQLPTLIDMAGPDAQRRGGVTKEELDRLQYDRRLNPDQQRAAKYLRDNYDELETGGWRGSSKITPRSLKENADEATNVDPRRVEQARRQDEEAQRRFRESERKGNEVEVGKGWGWYRVAEEALKKQGQDRPSPQDIVRETERLQKLNPDKVKMLHPHDKIKI